MDRKYEVISSTSNGKTDSKRLRASILACVEAICFSDIGSSEDISAGSEQTKGCRVMRNGRRKEGMKMNNRGPIEAARQEENARSNLQSSIRAFEKSRDEIAKQFSNLAVLFRILKFYFYILLFTKTQYSKGIAIVFLI